VNLRSAIQFASAALALGGVFFGAAPSIAAGHTPIQSRTRKAFQKYFNRQIPQAEAGRFRQRSVSMNEDMHKQWEEKEQFPPY